MELKGNFEIRNQNGELVYRGTRMTLCRCGGSANKPFCDSTHLQNGFSAP
ncbi:MAG: CDGSH iron-sulfur domain-containing protein [Anaerolineales bacterium]